MQKSSLLASTPSRRFVIPLVSELAGGLIFCVKSTDNQSLSIAIVSEELCQLLSLLEAGRFRELHEFAFLPAELLSLKGICLKGEPDFTLCPNFDDVIEELVRLRGLSRFPEFKIILLTKGDQLEAPVVQLGLRRLLVSDEIWIRLDSSGCRDESNLIEKILGLATKRPIILQSAFFALHGEGPSQSEIRSYIRQIKRLKKAGARISLIQVFSPPVRDARRDQLKLRNLAVIARKIREETGYTTEFY